MEKLRVTKKMGTSGVLEAIQIFEEAGRHMSKEKFLAEMKRLYGDSVNEEEVISIYRKIKASCKNIAHPSELRDYLLNKFIATQKMKKKALLFPKPFTTIPVDCAHSIIGLFFSPSEDLQSLEGHVFSGEQLKPYQRGHYLSVTSNGQLTTWSDIFQQKANADLIEIGNLYSKCMDLHITASVYVAEVQQLAVSTDKKELIFYDCSKFLDSFTLKHVLIAEKSVINTLNYWSDGAKAIFSFGDEEGCLTVLISYNVKKNGLFCSETCTSSNGKGHPLISTLFTKNSTRYMSFEIPIFFDACRQIQYCPSINTFAVCGTSSMKMGVVTMPPPGATDFVKIVLETEGLLGFFSCAAYSHSTKRLLTGGKDGSIRVWIPEERTPENTLAGHFKPVTHVMSHPQDRILVSLSEDMAVCVWAEDTWVCLQTLKVKNMGIDRISCMCYNLYNNELVLANSNIATCLGKGTDLFKEALTSHEDPIQVLCYHSFFNLVISACQNGMVTVWDIETGKSVIEFDASANGMRLTALSIDGSNRRLITATEDGQLRLWNFSSGTELAVLPITVPGTVSAIVCKNNRVFVSQKKSNIIYNLGINGHENRFLEHDYLRDIFFMDVHKKTLVASSSNGNVVVWDVLTSVALFWFSSTASSQIYILSKADRGRTGGLPVARVSLHTGAACRTSAAGKNTVNGNSGLLIKILKSRQTGDDGATVLTSTDGYIHAWSIVREGGLLETFRALKDEGAVVTAMSTDVDERTLLTGDNAGRIYLWDITSFGLKMEDSWPCEDTECTCILLASWEGHRSDVLDLHCDTAGRYVVSAGLDYNVKLWTKTGRLLGLFGQGEWGTDVKPYQLQISTTPEPMSQVSSIASTDDAQENPEEPFDPEEAVPQPKAKLKKESDAFSHRELFSLCNVSLPYRPLAYPLQQKKEIKQKTLWKLYDLKLRLESPAPVQQEAPTPPLKKLVSRKKKSSAQRKPACVSVFHTTVRPYQRGFENAEKPPAGILTRHLESKHELLKYSWPTRIYCRRQSDHLPCVRKLGQRGQWSLPRLLSGKKPGAPGSRQQLRPGPKYTMVDVNQMLTEMCKELELQSEDDDDSCAETESMDLSQTESETVTDDMETEEAEDSSVEIQETPKRTKVRRRRRRIPPTTDAFIQSSSLRDVPGSMKSHLLKLDQVENASARRTPSQASELPVTEATGKYNMSDIEAFLVMYHSSSHQA